MIAPAPPWQLDYADGCGNHYRLEAAGATVALRYAPVTPAMSSTGRYDGGPPRAATVAVDDPRLATLWRLLAAQPSSGPRAKGTGAATLTAAGAATHRHVPAGPDLAALDALLAALAAG
ncbi:MAG: hypothetical protein JNK64_25505 [Myxococcales bacterium]|nr:hypothetical protein [Myxococcales bacterium]